MARLFGTDGIRGVANTELTCHTAFLLGQAVVHFLGKNIVVGGDTRRSRAMLCAALSAGVCCAGGNVVDIGIIPTPGVAVCMRKFSADAGVVISASHNPPEFNGLKVFSASGFKLSDEKEDEIEAFIGAGGLSLSSLGTGMELGEICMRSDATDVYIEEVLSAVPDLNLEGIKVVLDVGHGASYKSSPEAFARLGADLHLINDGYTGSDINVECGSTNLNPLKEEVLRLGADIGIAHDGDADRVMMVDSKGREIDGDRMLLTCGIALKKQAKLAGNALVSTVMCNMGFVKAAAAHGIEVFQTKVGDRYVLEKMLEGGYVLGGEQSGHIIFLEHSTTGDGLLSALQFLSACKYLDLSAASACDLMASYPQCLVNVKVNNKEALSDNVAIQKALESCNEWLSGRGRILLRPSGTEPCVRVMVEAETKDMADDLCRNLGALVEKELGV